MKEKEKKEFEISRELHFAVRLLGYLLALLLIFFTGRIAITFCLGLFANGDYVVQLPGQESPVIALADTDSDPEPVYIDPSEVVEIARAKIAVTGDVMLHLPIVRSSETANGYNFDSIFTYIRPHVSAADYAVANLETTLSGTEGKEYTGYPNFNSPDAISVSAKRAGFDLLLTGNNHSYDYGIAGLKRTLNVLKTNELDTLGTLESREESRHVLKTIGGVRIGMASYTFADIDDNGNVTINGLTTDSTSSGLINAFDYDKLSQFYTEVEGQISAMRASGVDAIVFYIHWGDSYATRTSEDQEDIAQRLCDLGVDVIAGSHPHVVQPIDLLTSTTDPNHQTLCLYSLGNFLSNQRANNISLTSGHSEDAILASFTLSKYNDGSVRVSAFSLMPTWVLIRGTGDDRDFYVLPLDQTISDWKTTYELSSAQHADARNSYNRTMAIVTPGLNKITTYLSEKNAFLDPTLGVG